MRNSACLGTWAEAMNEQSWMSAVGKFFAAANRKVRPSQKIILKSMHIDTLFVKMKIPLCHSK